MTLTEFLKRVNYALRGTDDDVPTVGDDDANYWVTTLNRKKDEMYDDPTKKWGSAFNDEISAGAITAATIPSFNLPANFISEADEAFVVDLNGQYHYYAVVKPNEKNRRIQQVYISGQNPQKLKFTAPILGGTTIVGGTLYLPGYYRPADIPGVSGAEVIPIDDPNWGVMATAAQIAFNDITYEEKFDDLEGQASVLWKNMVKKNRRRNRGNAQVTPVSVTRIRGVR